MARVTVTISTPSILARPADAGSFPLAAKLLDGWGRRAVADTQQGPWADSMFRKPTGRSRKAWAHEVVAPTSGPANFQLRLINTATNRYGTPYAQYVHYAGQPKTDKVVFRVDRHLQTVIGPEITGALIRDFKRALKSGPKTTRKQTSGS